MTDAEALPRAVLWDMDGTLLDSEVLWDIAVAELAERQGFEMTPELRESTLGNSMTDALTKIYDAAGISASDRDYVGDDRWLIDRVTQLFEEDLPWRPGAQAALDLVAASGRPMALVTNTVRELTTVALETIGADRFAASVCGDEIPSGKPAPDIYLHAARLLDLDPPRCLAVEDSPTGTMAATSAGCPTLVVPSAASVPDGPLRVFRPSLEGLTLDDLETAWRAGGIQPSRGR